MNAAFWAKTMLDHVFIEGIRAHVFWWREQLDGIAWHKSHQRAFALAHGAIARHDFGDFTFNFKGDLTTMTTSLVFHGTAPFLLFE